MFWKHLVSLWVQSRNQIDLTWQPHRASHRPSHRSFGCQNGNSNRAYVPDIGNSRCSLDKSPDLLGGSQLCPYGMYIDFPRPQWRVDGCAMDSKAPLGCWLVPPARPKPKISKFLAARLLVMKEERCGACGTDFERI